MADKGKTIPVQGVCFERELAARPDEVWRLLTQCELLPDWYGRDGSMEPHEGGALNFMGGHIRGVVTRWRPEEYLAYSWNAFDEGEMLSSYPESYLSLALQPTEMGVLLTLQHYPLPERFIPQTLMGWHTFLDLLSATAAGRKPEAREVYMARNAKLYGVDLDRLEE